VLQSIQGLRAIAALLVVFVHVTIVFGYSKSFGAMPLGGFWMWGSHGVDLFFVISGFIMGCVARDAFMHQRGAQQFLASRVIRIFLPYWPVLAAILVVHIALPQFWATRDLTAWSTIVRSALLLPGTDGVLPVAWTLEHEMTFYAILFLVLAHRAVGVSVFIAWQVGSVVMGFFDPVRTFTMVPVDLEFSMGLLAAELFQRRATIPHPLATLVCGIVLFVVRGLWETYIGAFNDVGFVSVATYGMASMMIVVGAVFAERMGLLRTPGALLALGNASYAIYLVHFQVIAVFAGVLRKVGLNLPQWITPLGIAVAAAAILAGYFYHSFIERPLLTFGRRLTMSRSVGRKSALGNVMPPSQLPPAAGP